MPQRSPEDGLIDWSLPARHLYDFIRAQTRPYPGAFTRVGDSLLRIWAARPTDVPGAGAGRPVLDAERLMVGCGDGNSLEILEISVNGKDVAVASWWRDNGLAEADHAFS